MFHYITTKTQKSKSKSKLGDNFQLCFCPVDYLVRKVKITLKMTVQQGPNIKFDFASQMVIIACFFFCFFFLEAGSHSRLCVTNFVSHFVFETKKVFSLLEKLFFFLRYSNFRISAWISFRHKMRLYYRDAFCDVTKFKILKY